MPVSAPFSRRRGQLADSLSELPQHYDRRSASPAPVRDGRQYDNGVPRMRTPVAAGKQPRHGCGRASGAVPRLRRHPCPGQVQPPRHVARRSRHPACPARHVDGRRASRSLAACPFPHAATYRARYPAGGRTGHRRPLSLSPAAPPRPWTERHVRLVQTSRAWSATPCRVDTGRLTASASTRRHGRPGALGRWWGERRTT